MIILKDIFEKLAQSKFRSRFKLSKSDIEYIEKKELDTIRAHAVDFVSRRIAPAYIENDGKQTPMRNHPVFKAQHATATCCRGCIQKWHGFEKNVELDEKQQKYIVDLIMCWIQKQIDIFHS